MAVIIGAILLLARPAANYKRNVESRGRNSHFAFTCSKRIRSKSRAVIGADREPTGATGKIGLAVRIAYARHRANYQFHGRGRSSGRDRASEE
jgi:hypothetical protein